MKRDPSARPLALSQEQRDELVRRSEAHRQNPDAATPLDEVVEQIERSLGGPPTLSPTQPGRGVGSRGK
jgi:hypothetical protein